MRWEDDAREAPRQTPLGFTMPTTTALEDLVYTAPSHRLPPAQAAPSTYADPGPAAPALALLVPAPTAPRDPTVPFLGGHSETAAESGPWDPRQPLALGSDTVHPDDLPTTGEDAHPDFPAPSGRPVAPGLSAPQWRPGGYPAPVGAPAGAAAPWGLAQPGGPAHVANPGAIARSGSVAPPAPADPYQAMRQPYPQARAEAPWQTPNTQYVYHPPIRTPDPVKVNIWMLVILALGAPIPRLAWLLFVVAWVLAQGMRGMRPAVSLGFRICAPILLFTWFWDLIGANPITTLANPLYQTCAQFACVAMILVTIIDYVIGRNRQH